MHWLADNLRWDIEADLATVFGPAVAYQVGRISRALAAALRGWVAGGGAAAR
jgi:ubiquinone biosynthesis protein UbiJ